MGLWGLCLPGRSFKIQLLYDAEVDKILQHQRERVTKATEFTKASYWGNL